MYIPQARQRTSGKSQQPELVLHLLRPSQASNLRNLTTVAALPGQPMYIAVRIYQSPTPTVQSYWTTVETFAQVLDLHAPGEAQSTHTWALKTTHAFTLSAIGLILYYSALTGLLNSRGQHLRHWVPRFASASVM
ncbi:hypothetical protein D9611_008296 [Ephemerocybe angulata]|uniref:Uncharacterized protein n=1 Tax=Ephemerocybe angulata TaxID=980116 RepID=A0A8H5BIK3_9AGAR|nr:hypothetical protein D9611_008296 [Tulosesus angulatus]